MSDYNDGILPEPCLRMDTHFGDEYESIEFGDGTGYIKAAPILAKVGALHEEIDRLLAENAELRKLVRIAGTYCVNGMCGKDDGCPLYLGKPYCALHDRMRELGVDA